MNLPMNAELAWYATGRFYADSAGALFDCGYFFHLAGPGSTLFAGDISEATAHFTFAAEPFSEIRLWNGDLALSVAPVGEFSIWLQDTPGASFDDPVSFARGLKIATLRRLHPVVGATLYAAAATNPPALFGSNVFSAELIASCPFRFGGRHYDLRELLPHGVTQFGTASANSATPPAGYTLAIPFLGSAIVRGGE